MDITITKEYTLAKAKADVKNEVQNYILECLREKYGTAELIRTGSDKSKTNLIGVIVGEGTGEDGEINPIVVAVSAAVKEFTNHASDKKTYVPFDFYDAAAQYDSYITTKAENDTAKAKAKAEQIATDEAKRAQIKAQATGGEDS